MDFYSVTGALKLKLIVNSLCYVLLTLSIFKCIALKLEMGFSVNSDMSFRGSTSHLIIKKVVL